MKYHFWERRDLEPFCTRHVLLYWVSVNGVSFIINIIYYTKTICTYTEYILVYNLVIKYKIKYYL